MPTKEHQIKELKESITRLKKYHKKLVSLGSTNIMVQIIAARIIELEIRLEKLEVR